MPASAPAPIGTSEPLVLNEVWTRTNEPIFRHVSVPGTYQKPAPYRLHTFTYSTGLALTGRSAACAPATATRPAAEPRRRLFTIFMFLPPVAILGGTHFPGSLVPSTTRPPAREPELPNSKLRNASQKLRTGRLGECPPKSRFNTVPPAIYHSTCNYLSHTPIWLFPSMCCTKTTHWNTRTTCCFAVQTAGAAKICGCFQHGI